MHAIWPSHIDSDACFAAAGFTEFQDSDLNWDENWETLVERVLSALSRSGDVIIENPISTLQKTSLWNRIFSGRRRKAELDLSLVQQIALTTTAKGFEQAVVSFSMEPALTLIGGDSHPLLWLLVKESSNWSFATLVDEISLDCRQQRLVLDWQHLIPRSIQSLSKL